MPGLSDLLRNPRRLRQFAETPGNALAALDYASQGQPQSRVGRRPASRASQAKEDEPNTLETGEVIEQISLPDGSLVKPATESGRLVKAPGKSNLYLDPTTGEPYNADPSQPTGLRSAWQTATKKARDGKIYASISGVGERELGPDPKVAADEAKAAAKREAENRRLALAREKRPYNIDRVTGEPVPLQTDEEWAAAKQAKAAKLDESARVKRLKDQADVIDLEADRVSLTAPKPAKEDEEAFTAAEAALLPFAAGQDMEEVATKYASAPATDEASQQAKAAAENYLAYKDKVKPAKEAEKKVQELKLRALDIKEQIINPQKWKEGKTASLAALPDDDLVAEVKAQADIINEQEEQAVGTLDTITKGRNVIVAELNSFNEEFQSQAEQGLTAEEMDALNLQKARLEQSLADYDEHNGEAKAESDAALKAAADRRDVLAVAGTELEGRAAKQAEAAGLAKAKADTMAKAKPLYEKWAKRLYSDDWRTEEETPRLAQEAAKAGLDVASAKEALQTYRQLDWSNTRRDAKTGQPIAEEVRTLPDGNVTVNPTMWGDAAAYQKAVEASQGTPEGKAKALKVFPKLQEIHAEKAVEILSQSANIPGADNFMAWRERKIEEDQATQGKLGFARQSPAKQAIAYMEEMKNRSWFRKAGEQVAMGLLAGFQDIATQALGVGGMVTGSETLADLAAANSENTQSVVGAQNLEGSDTDYALRTMALASRMTPGVAALIAGAGVIGGGLATASILAGGQTAGSVFADLYRSAKDEAGLSHSEAWKKAALPAALAGTITGLLTKGMGATGLERVFSDTATQETARNTFKAMLGQFVKGAAEEMPEEVADEYFTTILQESAASADPVATLKNFAATLPELAGATALMGGAGALMQARRQAGTEGPGMAPPPEGEAPAMPVQPRPAGPALTPEGQPATIEGETGTVVINTDLGNIPNDAELIYDSTGKLTGWKSPDATPVTAPTPAPETQQDVTDQIAKFNPTGATPLPQSVAATAKRTGRPPAAVARQAAAGVVKIAQGQSLESLDIEEQEALGFVNKGGKIVPADNKVTPLVYDYKGKPVLRNAAAEWLTDEAQEGLAGMVNLTEAERKAQIDAEEAAAKAKTVKASRLKDIDREYAEAVKAGDLTKAQELVDEAAREAGLRELYHGSSDAYEGEKTFEDRDTSSGADAMGIYMSPDRETSEGYGQTDRYWVEADLPGFDEFNQGLSLEDIAAGKTTPTSGDGENSVWRNHNGTIEIVVNKAAQIRSSKAVVKDSSGRVIPPSERFAKAKPAAKKKAGQATAAKAESTPQDSKVVITGGSLPSSTGSSPVPATTAPARTASAFAKTAAEADAAAEDQATIPTPANEPETVQLPTEQPQGQVPEVVPVAAEQPPAPAQEAPPEPAPTASQPKHAISKGAVIFADVYRSEGDVTLTGEPVWDADQKEWMYPAVTKGGRGFRVAERFVSKVVSTPAATPTGLSPAQAAKPTPEPALTPAQADQMARAQAEYESSMRYAEADPDPQIRESRKKAAGMRFSAIKRQITGKLTGKEQEAKAKREASNFEGKAVSVDGKNAEVIGNAFGKVKVKFADGTKAAVPAAKVKPPVEAGPEAKPAALDHPAIKPHMQPKHQARVQALEAQGVQVVTVETEEDAAKVLGVPLKSKGNRGVTAMVNGKPVVIFIAKNFAGKKDGGAVITEELHHAAALVVLQQNPELLNEALTEVGGLNGGTAIYSKWDSLTPLGKLIEAAAAYASGKWNPDASSPVKRLVDAIMDAISKAFGLDAAQAKTATAKAIRSLADSADALLDSQPMPQEPAQASQKEASQPAPAAKPPEQMTPEEVVQLEYQRQIKPLTPAEYEQKFPKPKDSASRLTWANDRKRYLWQLAAANINIPNEWVRDMPSQEFVLAAGYVKQGNEWVRRKTGIPPWKGVMAENSAIMEYPRVQEWLQKKRENAEIYAASSHSDQVNSAVWEGDSKPSVNAAAVEAYGIKLPAGYVREGDLYVYRPEASPAPASQEAGQAEAGLEVGDFVRANGKGPVFKIESIGTDGWVYLANGQGSYSPEDAAKTLVKSTEDAAAKEAVKGGFPGFDSRPAAQPPRPATPEGRAEAALAEYEATVRQSLVGKPDKAAKDLAGRKLDLAKRLRARLKAMTGAVDYDVYAKELREKSGELEVKPVGRKGSILFINPEKLIDRLTAKHKTTEAAREAMDVFMLHEFIHKAAIGNMDGAKIIGLYNLLTPEAKAASKALYLSDSGLTDFWQDDKEFAAAHEWFAQLVEARLRGKISNQAEIEASQDPAFRDRLMALLRDFVAQLRDIAKLVTDKAQAARIEAEADAVQAIVADMAAKAGLELGRAEGGQAEAKKAEKGDLAKAISRGAVIVSEDAKFVITEKKGIRDNNIYFAYAKDSGDELVGGQPFESLAKARAFMGMEPAPAPPAVPEVARQADSPAGAGAGGIISPDESTRLDALTVSNKDRLDKLSGNQLSQLNKELLRQPSSAKIDAILATEHPDDIKAALDIVTKANAEPAALPDLTPPQAAAVAKEEAMPEPAKQAAPFDAAAAKGQKKFLLAEVAAAVKAAPRRAEMTQEQKDTINLLESLPTALEKASTKPEGDRLRLSLDAAKADAERLIGYVSIEVPGDGTFTILNEKGALAQFQKRADKFPVTQSRDDLPAKPTAQAPTAVPALKKPKTTADVVAAMFPMVSTDTTRGEGLQKVKGEGTYLWATNGRFAVRVEHENGGGKGSEAVIYDEKGNAQPWPEGEQNPSMEAVTPDDKTFPSYTLDTARWFSLMSQARAVIKDLPGEDESRFKSVSLYRNPDGSLGVFASDINRGDYAHNIQPEAQILAAYSPDYFQTILRVARNLGHEQIELRIQDDVSPATLRAGKALFVLMPMRVQQARSPDTQPARLAPPVTAEPSPAAQAPAEGTEAAQPAQAPAKAGIADFGEKLGGARKDKAATVNEELTDDEIAGKTLSEIWPKSEIASIEDDELAAYATTLRSVIPTKPQKGYKLNAWVAKVKTVKELMRFATEKGVPEMVSMLRSTKYNLSSLADKIAILQGIPREHWGRIGEVRNFPNAYRYGEGAGNMRKIPTPYAEAEVDGRNVRADNLDALLEVVSAKVAEGKTEPKMQFEVRGRPSKWGINKKGDPLYRKLKTFEDSKEALAYITSNYADLVAAWEGVKERDNIKETDLRKTENRPRTAEDWRKGKDATPEMFAEAFGFRGVEFGNWVSQGKNAKERQGMMNEAYDALHDLASILNIPTKALSLNGQIGLGFGSRGHGWASAHYEPGNLVINLTKTRGAGSLAHELFHAFDHYFGRARGASIKNNAGVYITNEPETRYVNEKTGHSLSVKRWNEIKAGRGRITNEEDWKLQKGVRPEVEEAFTALVKALDDSPMAKRASLNDKGKQGYWGSTIERAARSFENYVIHKMQQKGYQNDYLANVVGIEDFVRDPGRYPYLLDEEIAPVAKAFDDLFATIKTRETDSGVALYNPPRPADKGQPAGLGLPPASRGYLGTVADGDVIAVKVSNLERASHANIREIASASHEDGAKDFRYNPQTQTVYWGRLSAVTEAERQKVADWLEADGSPVTGHKQTSGNTANYAEAHGVPAGASLGLPPGGVSAEDAKAKGYTLKAYRGVSQQTPFNDSETVWATTNKDVADSYAVEVFGYDDPEVVELLINPSSIPRTDLRKLTDEERESMEVDSFGNPQKIGIYANSDDSPLGSSYPQTAIHAPKSAALVKKDDGLFYPLALPPQSQASVGQAVNEAFVKKVQDSVQAGRPVGTSNPTTASKTGEGTDSAHNVELDRLRKNNPLAYRQNALILTRYPVVAKKYRALHSALAKADAPVIAAKEEVKKAKAALAAAQKGIKDRVALLRGMKASQVRASLVNEFIAANLTARAVKAKDVAHANLAKANAKAAKAADYQSKAISEILDGNAIPEDVAAQIYEDYITAVESNLLTLIKLFPKRLRDVARLWYDGANIIAQKFGKQYNATLEQASGVLAVFSPQKDWFMNVSLAQRMMNIWANDQETVWNPEMTKQFIMRSGEPQPVESIKKGDTEPTISTRESLITDANPEGIVYQHGAIKKVDDDGNTYWENWDNQKAAENLKAAQLILKDLEGKTLSQIKDRKLKARFIRILSEVRDSSAYPIVTPDGRMPGTMQVNNDKVTLSKVAWGGYNTIEKAISIMERSVTIKGRIITDEHEVISIALGDQHKVRSFYNNIVDPANKSGHVTMDTHAIAAIHWMPHSGSSLEVTQNFGGGGVKNDGIAGIKGTYAANAEAYRRAAVVFKLLPREVQSITWEAVRLLFPKEFKTKGNIDKVRAIWNRYLHGDIDIETARAEIFTLATTSKDFPQGKDIAGSIKDGKGLGDTAWAAAMGVGIDNSGGPEGTDDSGTVPKRGGPRGPNPRGSGGKSGVNGGGRNPAAMVRPTALLRRGRVGKPSLSLPPGQPAVTAGQDGPALRNPPAHEGGPAAEAEPAQTDAEMEAFIAEQQAIAEEEEAARQALRNDPDAIDAVQASGKMSGRNLSKQFEYPEARAVYQALTAARDMLGGPETVQLDKLREWAKKTFESDPEKYVQWAADMAEDNKLLDVDEQAVLGQAFQFLTREARLTGDKNIRALLNKVGNYYLDTGTRLAQAMSARRDPLETPQERWTKALDIVFGPSEAVRRKLRILPTQAGKARRIASLEAELDEARGSRRADVEAALKTARAQETKEELLEKDDAESQKIKERVLKNIGVTEDDLMLSGTDRVALQSAVLDLPAVKAGLEAYKGKDNDGYNIMRLAFRGFSDEHIANALNLNQDDVGQFIHDATNAIIRPAVAEQVKAGTGFGGLIKAGFARLKKAVGLGLPPKAIEDQPSLIKGTRQTVDDVTAEVNRVMAYALQSAKARNSGKLMSKVVMTPGGQRVRVFVPFDPDDMANYYAFAREYTAAKASAFDKVYEYWINWPLLSGPQTQVANITGNAAQVAWHYTGQRLAEATLNLAYQDPNAPQFREFKHILKGFWQGIGPAFEMARQTFLTEGDTIRHKYLGQPLEIDVVDGDLDKVGNIRASVGGQAGRISRLPGRVLRFTDAFFKTAIMYAEASAVAYRRAHVEAKRQGLKGQARAAFIDTEIANTINDTSSGVWGEVMKTAEELLFQDENMATEIVDTALGGYKGIRDLEKLLAEAEAKGDSELAAKLQKRIRSRKFVGSLMRWIFPFQRTPTNIVRAGIKKAGGSAISLLYGLTRAGWLAMGKDGVPMIKSYPKAMQIKDASETLLAGLGWLALASMLEGDDNDDEKPVLLVGTRSHSLKERAATDQFLRKYGGENSIVWQDGKGKVLGSLPFGRYEPAATLLTTWIDAYRNYQEVKRLKSQGENASYSTYMLSSLVSSLEDKSFLQGFANAMQFIRDVEEKRENPDENAGVKMLMNNVIPNLIKQPLRNMDDVLRERTTAGPGYAALPNPTIAPKLPVFAAQPKISTTGERLPKAFTPPARLLFQANTKVTPQPDALLYRANRLHPTKRWSPQPLQRDDYNADPPGKAKPVPITDPAKKRQFAELAGRLYASNAAQVAARAMPSEKAQPSESLIKAFKKAREDAMAAARAQAHAMGLHKATATP